METLSNRVIWEYLKDDKIEDLYNQSTYNECLWIKKYESSLCEMFGVIKSVAEMTYNLHIDEDMTYEQASKTINLLHENFHTILLGMFEGKNIDEFVWTLIYPEMEQKYSI